MHFIVPVPLHVERAQQRSEAQPERPLASIRRAMRAGWDGLTTMQTPFCCWAPLYHLTERGDRVRALQEAWRVLQPGGVLLVAAISRFASALDGLVSRYFIDPRFAGIVWQDLADGQHRGTPEGAFFTTAYLHRPEELALEMAAAGFVDSSVVAIEGPGWLLQDFEAQWADPGLREPLLEVIRRTESEPSLLGVSSHLLGIAHKARLTSWMPKRHGASASDNSS